jgi:2-polyprenyl-3-methyl-5-hydroxy-6-metoxy-1,4-benzoquinol methylase
LESLRHRQISEPQIETKNRLKIPILQEIKNNISSKVREQYEQNPYPRWVNVKKELSSKPISKITKDLKLNIINLSINEVTAPQILIAGCGTGQHSIETSSMFNDCNVLAIDLSLSSLAYAKRKTEELDISNIEYMQADILDLESLNRKFDVIESVGVLHHMDDPMAGWQILTDSLKPGGLMRIGLYSEIARRHIVQIHDEIKKLNIDSSADSMRLFRNRLISSEKKHHKLMLAYSDFYSMSMLRDLLFHVQEHRFTISQIKQSLHKFGLIFCGFNDLKVVEIFNSKHLHKNLSFDLDKWAEFEKENPDSFAGMYQFWCQKL